MTPGPILAALGDPAHVWTGKQMLVWGRIPPQLCLEPQPTDPCIAAIGGRYEPSVDQWRSISADTLPMGMLQGRYGLQAVWTGKEMIVWGGRCLESVVCDGGAAYDPDRDQWRPMADANGPPRGRSDYAAVWTGSKMIVWGGTEHNVSQQPVTLSPVGDGFAYDPAKDAWIPISSVGAPSPQSHPAFVWTGKEMMIWGLGAGSPPSDAGALYDPVADTWRAISSVGAPPRDVHAALWTGSEVLVWGITKNAGALYDPVTDQWRPIASADAPQATQGLPLVWTGTEFVVWSADTGGAGGRYDPKKNQWGAMSTAGQPSPRRSPLGVWTGQEMIVWSGAASGSQSLADGARFTP